MALLRDMLARRHCAIIEEVDEYILTEKIVAFKCVHPSIGLSLLQTVVARADALHRRHCIAVYHTNVSPKAASMIKEFANIGIHVELFNEKQLAIDPTRHVYAPCYDVLSSSDAAQHKTLYGRRMPRLLTSDPVARYLDLKVSF